MERLRGGYRLTKWREVSAEIEAPFPWFGGKSRVASLVWSRFGNVKNYVEPFFGSGAVLLSKPVELGECIETVNDLDGFVANFWRATKDDPEAVAAWADNPVNENDLHARHIWLVQQTESLHAKLNGDPDFYDARVAGYWVWGLCCWIGSGFCSGRGPWRLDVNKKLVHLGDAGRGVNKQRVHLSDAGQGVKKQRDLVPWFIALSERLARTRVCSGDWSRVCGPSVTTRLGLTGVFLDPPYADTAKRAGDLYNKDSQTVAHEVRAWALANGDNPKMRIALCGYEGEHVIPETWECVPWKAKGGYGGQKKEGENTNAHAERIWFSPHCVKPHEKQGGFL